MNRIYQGKVTAVEIPDGKDDQGKPKWKPFDSDAKKNREQWPSALPDPLAIGYSTWVIRRRRWSSLIGDSPKAHAVGYRSLVIGHSPQALDAVNFTKE